VQRVVPVGQQAWLGPPQASQVLPLNPPAPPAPPVWHDRPAVHWSAAPPVQHAPWAEPQATQVPAWQRAPGPVQTVPSAPPAPPAPLPPQHGCETAPHAGWPVTSHEPAMHMPSRLRLQVMPAERHMPLMQQPPFEQVLAGQQLSLAPPQVDAIAPPSPPRPPAPPRPAVPAPA
jgi:hypothetical protein